MNKITIEQRVQQQLTAKEKNEIYKLSKNIIIKPNYGYLIAKQENKIVGYAEYRMQRTNPLERALIIQNIRANEKNKGIGTALEKRLLNIAMENKINHIGGISSKSSQNFWKKRGYEIQQPKRTTLKKVPTIRIPAHLGLTANALKILKARKKTQTKQTLTSKEVRRRRKKWLG